MSIKTQGFSLVEVVIAMAVSSILLLGSARFLPALQRASLLQTKQQMLEEEVWQRVFILSRHLQRAGYCRSNHCAGEALHLEKRCALVRWDSSMSRNSREEAPVNNADVTGFRLQGGALETLRGATNCEGKGWEKMTDPDFLLVEEFTVVRKNISGFAPELTITLAARLRERQSVTASARYSVTGYNL